MSAIRTFRILGPIFAGLGGLLACIGLVLAISQALFVHGASVAEGRVIGIEGGVPHVQVSLPGGRRTIKGSISSQPPSLEVGERVPVLYQADSADGARIGSFLELWFAPVLLFGLGTPFAAIGAGFLLIVTLRNRRDRELRETGRKLIAKVIALEPSLLRINRRPAKILVAEASDPAGQTLTFRSDALLVEESQWLGKHVIVYVDVADPQRYALQLDET